MVNLKLIKTGVAPFSKNIVCSRRCTQTSTPFGKEKRWRISWISYCFRRRSNSTPTEPSSGVKGLSLRIFSFIPSTGNLAKTSWQI
jgi:hypothetical protein